MQSIYAHCTSLSRYFSATCKNFFSFTDFFSFSAFPFFRDSVVMLVVPTPTKFILSAFYELTFKGRDKPDIDIKKVIRFITDVDSIHNQARTSSAVHPHSVPILVTGQILDQSLGQSLSLHRFFESSNFECDGCPFINAK